MQNNNKLKVLLVEDTEGHVRLVVEAVKRAGCHFDLHIATDGYQATMFLNSIEESPPDLVLLDLNLPRKNGLEVLKDIRLDEDLKGIKVFIFTSSSSKKEINLATTLEANGFIEKPNDFSSLIGLMKKVENLFSKNPSAEKKQKDEFFMHLNNAMF